MSCFGLSRSSSQKETDSCLHKPLTKAAFLGMTFLFAGGAIAAHYVGLGIPGIASFSLAGGGSLTIFILACISSVRDRSEKPQEQPAENSKRLDEPENFKVQQTVKRKEIQTYLEGLANQDLFGSLTPVFSKEAETSAESEASMMVLKDSGLINLIETKGLFSLTQITGAPSLDQADDLISKTQAKGLISLGEANQLIFSELTKRISSEIKKNQNIDELVKALQVFFSLVKDNPQQFHALVIIMLFDLNYPVQLMANIFEKLEWPSEEMKAELLPKYLIQKILVEWISYTSEWIDDLEVTVTNLTFITKKIFLSGQTVSETVAKAIGYAIRFIAEKLMQHVETDLKKRGALESKKSPVGIKVRLTQYTDFRFSASLMAPLLPYLCNIPGLIGLDLSDIGVQNPRDLLDEEAKKRLAPGFSKEHANALLEIFRTNPHLSHVTININGMSEEDQQEFHEKWAALWSAKASLS